MHINRPHTDQKNEYGVEIFAPRHDLAILRIPLSNLHLEAGIDLAFTADTCRLIAYLFTQAADKIDGKVTAIDDDGYEVEG